MADTNGTNGTTEVAPLRIVKLEAADVLRLKAVAIEPTGDLVVVGGENGAGKTSVLNCIEMALGGGETIPRLPIRAGRTKGHIVLDLEDFRVERTFTAKGSELVVRSKDGAKQPSPQAILDALVGELTFDPLAFKSLDAKRQREVLQSLVGLDFTDVTSRRAEAFRNRTEKNREVGQSKARLASLKQYPDAPTEEVSSAELMAELERREAVNKANRLRRDALEDENQRVEDAADDVVKAKQYVAELERDLEAAKVRLKNAEIHQRSVQEDAETIAREVSELVDADTGEIKQQISTADERNGRVRANKRYADEAAALKSHESQAERLTAEIEGCDDEKVRMLTEAKWPVDGLSFSDDGVTLNGVPFEQISESEALRVSCAMGLAQHPRLRVMLIRNAPYLGEEAFRTLAEIAAEHGAQLWIEQGGNSKHSTVIISDGTAEAVEMQEAAQ